MNDYLYMAGRKQLTTMSSKCAQAADLLFQQWLSNNGCGGREVASCCFTGKMLFACKACEQGHWRLHVKVAIGIKRVTLIVVLWVVKQVFSLHDAVARMTTSTHVGLVYDL